MNTALILSGGKGTRLKTDGTPKQYLEVAGRSIISYCLETFLRCDKIDAVVIVLDDIWQEHINDIANRIGLDKPIAFAKSGETRQMSIYNGLEKIAEQFHDTRSVIIHDAARPLVSEEMIVACLEGLKDADGVMPTLPVKDTCYLSADGESITRLIPRSELFAGQAPEAFDFKKYLELCRNADSEYLNSMSGTSELAFRHGLKVRLIEGDERNFKVTTKADLEMLKKILSSEGNK